MEPKVKRSVLPKTRAILAVFLVAFFLFGIARLAIATARFISSTGLAPSTIVHLAFDTGSKLESTNGRTNVLLLGIAGGEYPGAKLTDTMLIVSLKPANQSMAMVSVPRDIWSDTLKDRINSAYYYGEQKREGGGIVLSRAIIEDMSGVTLHYGLVIDFSGFREMIDVIGGIDVAVPEAFVDPDFPIVGREEDACNGDPEYRCRYETLQFEAGMQHMNGDIALKYVRSRHAEGEEGSDFARSRRQQEVLLAVRNRLMDPKLWLMPGKARAIFDALDKTTHSDMTLGEFLTLGKLIARAKGGTKQISIEHLLYVPPASWYGRYVLLPENSFEEVHSYLASELED